MLTRPSFQAFGVLYYMPMQDALTFNEKDSRYEKSVDGHVVYARTHRKGEILYVDYVFTPPELRGQGAASAFMKDLMALAREQNLKVVPVCGFAAGWLRKHPEHQDLAAPPGS